jgi:hypothetical protein
MATLDHLPIPSLSSLSDDEGIALILSMRERRHFVPNKPVREKKSKIPTESAIAKLSEKQLAELYYTLMAKRQQELI